MEHLLLFGKRIRGSVINIISNFFANFFFLSPQGCRQTFSGESGVIRSPNHPEDHPVSLDCSYLICVPKEKLVSLRFTHFDLEPAESELY